MVIVLLLKEEKMASGDFVFLEEKSDDYEEQLDDAPATDLQDSGYHLCRLEDPQARTSHSPPAKRKYS